MDSPSRAELADAAHRVVLSPELVPERAGTVAFVSNQTRKGHWILPRLFRIVSFFGNVEIDLTYARVGAGTSRIEVMAFMGNVEVTVPPWLRVESDGSGILANFEADTKVKQSPPPDAPLISIGGSAFMSNVEIRVVDPDAPGWFARLTAGLRGESR